MLYDIYYQMLQTLVHNWDDYYNLYFHPSYQNQYKALKFQMENPSILWKFSVRPNQIVYYIPVTLYKTLTSSTSDHFMKLYRNTYHVYHGSIAADNQCIEFINKYKTVSQRRLFIIIDKTWTYSLYRVTWKFPIL